MQMSTKTIVFAILAALACTVLFMVSCGGGDDDDDSTSSDDDDVQQGEEGKLQAYVHDFQTKQPVQGALVQALNDETGEPLDPAVTATSPEDGGVTLTIPEGVEKVVVRVTKSNCTDTVQFHFDVGVTGEEFLLVSNATKDLVAATLGVTIDLTKAMSAGGVYWGDPASESSIGCSVVSFDPDDGSHMYYFGPDALPASARDVTGDTPINGQGTNPAYDSKGHAISYFLAINKDVASDLSLLSTIYADQGGDGTGSSVQSSDTVPRLFENTVTIANVYFDKTTYAENPTPSWCTQ
jgi:hypothetical protein